MSSSTPETNPRVLSLLLASHLGLVNPKGLSVDAKLRLSSSPSSSVGKDPVALFLEKYSGGGHGKILSVDGWRDVLDHFCSIYLPSFIAAFSKIDRLSFNSPHLYLFQEICRKVIFHQYILDEEPKGALLEHWLKVLSQLDTATLFKKEHVTPWIFGYLGSTINVVQCTVRRHGSQSSFPPPAFPSCLPDVLRAMSHKVASRVGTEEYEREMKAVIGEILESFLDVLEGKRPWGSSDLGAGQEEEVVSMGWIFCDARGCEVHGCGCDQTVELGECDEMDNARAGRSEFLICSNCRNAAYCSERHQRAHWKFHKSRCFKATW